MPISIGTGHNKLVGTSRCFSDCAGDAMDGCSERTEAIVVYRNNGKRQRGLLLR